jgi:branched-chain amino acid transport system permease protein
VAALTSAAYFVVMGLGIVLIYRQSGVLNFSQGPVGSLAAYTAYLLIQRGVSYWVAAAAGILVSAAVSAGIELLIIRRLSRHSSDIVGIATFGPGLVIIGVLGAIFGNADLPLPAPLGGGQLHLGFANIGYSELFAIAVAIVAIGAIYLLLQRSRFGLSLRAASEGPVTAGMLGINVSRTRTGVWALAGALGGFAALMVSGHYFLEPTFVTTFTFGSFAAIVLGGMESIVGLAVGSVLYGLLSSFFAFLVTARLLQTLNFITIAVALSVFPYGIFGRRLEHVAEPRIKASRSRGPGLSARIPRLSPRLVLSLRIVGIAVGVIGLIVMPFIIGDAQLYIVASVAAMFVATSGLNFISGYAGQGSLGQAGFIAIGAYVYAVLQMQLHFPSILAAIVAVVAAAAGGVLFGIPAIRLSGVYLAMITLAFTLAVPELAAFPQNVTGGSVGMAVSSDIAAIVPGLSLLAKQYWVIAIVAIGVAWISYRLGTGRLGRRWKAVRDSEPGAASVGIPVSRTKLNAFGLSGAFGGLSGVLTIIVVGYIAPDSYTVWLSAFLFAAIIIGGRGLTLGSALGSIFVVAIPFLTSSAAVWSQVFFGLSLLLVLWLFPGGLAALLNVFRGAVTPTFRRTGVTPPGSDTVSTPNAPKAGAVR